MKEEKITLGDRFISSLVIFLAAFFTALIVWLIVLFLSPKSGNIFTFPFIYVFYFSGVFTAIAFLSPKKSLDYMGWIWNKMDSFFKEFNRGGPS